MQTLTITAELLNLNPDLPVTQLWNFHCNPQQLQPLEPLKHFSLKLKLQTRSRWKCFCLISKLSPTDLRPLWASQGESLAVTFPWDLITSAVWHMNNNFCLCVYSGELIKWMQGRCFIIAILKLLHHTEINKYLPVIKLAITLCPPPHPTRFSHLFLFSQKYS